MADVQDEKDLTCHYGTHAPRDCPARVYALRGTTPPACPVRAEKDQRENLAARLFLADRERPHHGPFVSLPEQVKDRYRTLAQVAEHEFARRARQATSPSGSDS